MLHSLEQGWLRQLGDQRFLQMWPGGWASLMLSIEKPCAGRGLSFDLSRGCVGKSLSPSWAQGDMGKVRAQTEPCGQGACSSVGSVLKAQLL